MTSIAETESGGRRQNFSLRAYVAGGAATAALIAGAIVVFASLGAYVAFSGLPIGSGNGNASQLTIDAEAGAPAAAAAVFGRAPGAVAAAPTAASARAPANGQSRGGSGGGGSATGSTGASPTSPATGTTETSPSGVAAGQTSSATGTGDQGGSAANLPLPEQAGPVTGPVGGAVGGALGEVGVVLGPPEAGQALGDTVDAATGGSAGQQHLAP